MSIDKWVDSYRTDRTRYERLTHELSSLLKKLLSGAGIRAAVESRTKEVESFATKIIRPGKNYADPLKEVSDLCGLRVIVDTLTDVERVTRLLHVEFELDEKRSVNKAETLDPDRFGYLSQHFVVSLSKRRRGLAEWAGLEDLCAEIQVRTALQHTWSALQHPLDYKSSVEIPRPLRRRLFRLSALFELADDELEEVIKEAALVRASYLKEAKQKPSSIPIDLDSLKAYLKSSDEVAYWDRFINSLPHTKTESASWSPRDVAMPLKCGLKWLADYDTLLHESRGWGEKYLNDALLNIRRLPTADISMTKNGILLYLLIGNHPDTLTVNLLRGSYGFGAPEPMIALANKTNPRFKK